MLTGATFAGGQRYGFTWTGDNSATWNHLRLATQQLLNLGLSGISFVGDDIGGFNGALTLPAYRLDRDRSFQLRSATTPQKDR